MERQLKVLRLVGVLFLEDTFAFLQEVFPIVLHVLPDQFLNLRRLLKCSLELGQENIFNRSQLFLELVLFLAGFQ